MVEKLVAPVSLLRQQLLAYSLSGIISPIHVWTSSTVHVLTFRSDTGRYRYNRKFTVRGRNVPSIRTHIWVD